MADLPSRFPEPPRPQPTGRFLVLFHADAEESTMATAVEASTGAKTHALKTAAEASEALAKGDAVMISRFKIAAIEPTEEVGARMAMLGAAEGVRQVRPEFFMFAINDLRQRYANWVRDGLQLLAEGAGSVVGLERSLISEVGFAGAAFADTEDHTWGLQAVGAHRSRFTGRGVKVAVLDTGLDFDHPDFVGRPILSQSFVEGEDAQDVQGHGTHTAGTIAGPKRSNIGRRYGVAPDVELLVGKVLNNRGSGKELDILQGMNWAIDQGCVAISMSLGRPTFPGERPDPLYEEVGAAALRDGSLIIAAAGNESARDFGFIAPVGAPANSSSIMAVAAVDPTLKVAPFSCGGITDGGGEVNISGPGVTVYSSAPRPRLSMILQGTSMACPHVAGVAALWVESDPSLRGKGLWDALERTVRSLGPARDYGKGLVQSPDSVIGA